MYLNARGGANGQGDAFFAKKTVYALWRSSPADTAFARRSPSPSFASHRKRYRESASVANISRPNCYCNCAYIDLLARYASRYNRHEKQLDCDITSVILGSCVLLCEEISRENPHDKALTNYHKLLTLLRIFLSQEKNISSFIYLLVISNLSKVF